MAEEKKVRDVSVTFRMSGSDNDDLEEIARLERRNKSDMIRIALGDWITLYQTGALKKAWDDLNKSLPGAKPAKSKK